MRQFISLVKVLLKTGLGGGTATTKIVERKNKYGVVVKTQEKNRSLGLLIFIGICMIPLMILLYNISYVSTLALMLEGNEEIALNVMLSLLCVVSFAMGITVVLSVFYFTSDIQTYLFMPIRAEKLVAGKFLVALIYEYPIDIIMLAPLLAGYGVATSSGPLFWIFAVLVIILLPITPLIYGGIISMIIMRVSRIGKHRDVFSIVITLIIVVAVLGLNMVSNSFGRMDQDQIAGSISTLNDAFGGIVMKVFPITFFAKYALYSSSILWFLGFIAAIVVLFLVFMLLARILYIKGAIDISDSSAKGKAMSKEEERKIVVKKNLFITYMFKEVKILVRTPAFIMNAVLMAFIWPLIVMIPFASGFGFSNVTAKIAEISVDSSGDFGKTIIFFTGIVLTGMVGWFNMANSIAITKEGKNYFFLKYIPVPYEYQMRAKNAAGIFFGLLASLIYNIIALVILKASIPSIIINIAICICLTIFFNYLMMSVDISRPKLDWENETAAIKQNFNSLIAMLFVLLASVIVFVVPLLLNIFLKVNIYALGIGIIIAAIIAIIIADKIVIKKAVEMIKAL